MVNLLKTKLQIRSIVSVGIAVIGFIVSVICNSELYRAGIAFLLGVIFIVVAIVCESIFYCLATSSIRESELDDNLLWNCKMALLKMMEKAVSFIVIVFAAMTPLLLLNLEFLENGIGVFGVKCGITPGLWVKYGLVAILITGIICLVVCYLFNRRFVRENKQLLSDEELLLQKNAHKRNKKTGLIIVLALGITFLVQCFVNRVGNATWFTDGNTFDNYEDFVSFVESGDGEYTDTWESLDALDEEELEVRKEELVAEDGTVLCSYVWNNSAVVRIDFGDIDTGYLPITVYTDVQSSIYSRCINRINIGFLMLYIVEIVGILLFVSSNKEKN